ncbi:hypothetical protein KUTeg_004910 [Tegillarca granosa]|uniref:Uncharacterized protein n=1 Tax=Tegillarca granosa TaxID=220873 RepID=A0ABQ9FLF5_TEGGR|nr:hypothetical protein KUTeg_004910 [Tegillarca granosa]
MESDFSTFKTKAKKETIQRFTHGKNGQASGYNNTGFHVDTVQINVNNNNNRKKGRTNAAYNDEEFDRCTVSTTQSYNKKKIESNWLCAIKRFSLGIRKKSQELNILRQPNKDNPTDTERKEVPSEDLTPCQKATRITTVILKLSLLLLFLYLFVCSLDFLSSAFRLLAACHFLSSALRPWQAGRVAGSVFRESELLANPVCGVMIGVLATVLVQSSSTTTSIVVSMVSAGNLLDVKMAIYILMGANIGTSVTNTIVALGQIASRKEFRRAFSGATVHDMFNWLTVIIFLPIEVITGYLFYLSEAIVDGLNLERYDNGDQDLLKAITKPFTSKIVQVDENAISDIAEGKEIKSLLKSCCKTSLKSENKTDTLFVIRLFLWIRD